MAKQIKIRIFPDGKVQAETQGIKGKSCTNYIKILEDILGAEVVDSSYTPEYYEQETSDNIIKEDVKVKNGG